MCLDELEDLPEEERRIRQYCIGTACLSSPGGQDQLGSSLMNDPPLWVPFSKSTVGKDSSVLRCNLEIINQLDRQGNEQKIRVTEICIPFPLGLAWLGTTMSIRSPLEVHDHCSDHTRS